MKVLIVTTSYPAYLGHVQSPFIYELTRALSSHAEVDVVCPRYSESKASEEKYGKVSVHRFTYFFFPKWQTLTSKGGIPSNMKRSWFAKFQMPFFLMSMFFKTLKHARKADVIHCQWEMSGLIGALVKKFTGKPLLLSTRGLSVGVAAKSGFLRRLYSWIFKHCDFITPNNDHHREELKVFDVADSKIVSVPNGIATDKFDVRDAAAAQKKIVLSGDIVLFVGWLIERKGVHVLLDAWPSVVEKHPNAKLAIVGEGVEEEKLKKQASALGIDSSVVFVGSVPPQEIPNWMNASKMLVLPSFAEGRPNVVGEALASGIPVAVSNIGGSTEVVSVGKNGLVFPPKDSSKLAQAVVKILDSEYDPKEVRSLLLKKGASWDDCAKKFVDLYQSVL